MIHQLHIIKSKRPSKLLNTSAVDLNNHYRQWALQIIRELIQSKNSLFSPLPSGRWRQTHTGTLRNKTEEHFLSYKCWSPTFSTIIPSNYQSTNELQPQHGHHQIIQWVSTVNNIGYRNWCTYGCFESYIGRWHANINKLSLIWRPQQKHKEALACLLAKMRSTASLSSSSASILISSSLASFTRSRSLLSTTKIRPSKYMGNYVKCGFGEVVIINRAGDNEDPCGPQYEIFILI